MSGRGNDNGSQINWTRKKLSDVCNITMGQSPPSESYNDHGEGLPFFQGKAEFGELVPTPQKWCKAPKKVANVNDILLSVRAPVGPTNLSPSRCCIGRGLAAISPKENINNRFILYQLRYKASDISARGTGSTFNAISGKVLRNFVIDLAPLEQQERIVAKIEELFSKLDAGLTALEQVQSNLQRYRASVLKAAVEGRLTQKWRAENPDIEPADQLLERILQERREKWEQDQLAKYEAKGIKPPKNWQNKYKEPVAPDTSNLPDLPSGWCWATVDQIAFVEVGHAFKSSEFTNKGIALLRGDNIEPNALRWHNTKYWPENKTKGFEHLLIKEGDIILAMDRPLISSGLKIARVRKHDLPCLLVQRMARLNMIDDTMNEFVFAAMRTQSFIDHLRSGQTGTQLPHISGSRIASFAFPLPPLAEQEQISNELEHRLSASDRGNKTVINCYSRVKSLRQAILKWAFKGKLIEAEFGSDSQPYEIDNTICEAK